ncbi:MAG: hypothetical protein RLZZ301_1765 [Bacteroidota bacterium]|jgi:beta-glucosidase
MAYKFALLSFLCAAQFLWAQAYKDPTLPTEARVADLLSRMTPAEKAWQLFMVPSVFDTTKCRFQDGIFGIQLFASGQADPSAQLLQYDQSSSIQAHIARANAIQRYFVEQTRLGIPIVFFDEGLHGLVRGQATSFPQSIALAASFDPQLMDAVALHIAQEARQLGVRQVLSPVLNLASDVRWGRVEETYGEDPYLASQMGLHYCRALEQAGVVCTPKHFIANVGEGGRDSYPIGFSQRSLYMSHYRPFLTAIQEGGARSIMSAYNSFDGKACSSSATLLNETLKKDWGFRGFVLSDANAVGGEVVLHRTASTYAESGTHALHAGLDLIFQTDCAHFELFAPALLEQSAQIDSAVARVLRVKFELGLFEQPYLKEISTKTSEHVLDQGHELAQKSAEASFVLLKNEALLPLAKNTRIALFGAAAATTPLGGYSGTGYQNVSILAGLESCFGKQQVQYLPLPIDPWKESVRLLNRLSGPKGFSGEFKARYFANPNFEGPAVFECTEDQIDHHWTLFGPSELTGNGFYSARYTSDWVSESDTTLTIGLEGNGGFRLYINDSCLVSSWTKAGFEQKSTQLTLQKGKSYQLRVDFYEPQSNGQLRCFIQSKAAPLEEQFIAYEKAITSSDVAVVVVDYPEGEFQDRSSLALAPAQIRLINELNACGLPVLVVIVGGSAVTMSAWQSSADAILYAWYPGEAGGTALANVLSGQCSPSGKLPFSIPQSEGQLPLSYWHAPTGRGDAYVRQSGEALYPFGFGLSYSDFKYQQLEINKRELSTSDTLRLSFVIQNTGKFNAAEAIQFYIKPITSQESLPVYYLAHTEKPFLKKGETMAYIQLKIPVTAIGIPTSATTRAYPTSFYLQIGSSSKDIRLQSQPIKIVNP